MKTYTNRGKHLNNFTQNLESITLPPKNVSSYVCYLSASVSLLLVLYFKRSSQSKQLNYSHISFGAPFVTFIFLFFIFFYFYFFFFFAIGRIVQRLIIIYLLLNQSSIALNQFLMNIPKYCSLMCALLFH